MPTLPPSSTEDPQPHRYRHMAESFGTDADRYDRTRPTYPDELIERIARPGLEILDVGCGTGIEARQLQAAGCTVLGVEPDERMAAFARSTGVEVEVSTFETWEAAGRMFDAVVAGTAWHWVDPVAGAAKAAQVLRPGGRLAPFWHVFQFPPDLAEAVAAIYQRVVPDSPLRLAATASMIDSYQGFVAKLGEAIAADGAYETPEQWRFDWSRSYTRDEYVNQLPTTGAMTTLAPEQQAEILAGVGEAIDAEGGRFTMTYATLAISAIRR
jgi:SAM-dependent methyltransferase